MNTNFSKLRFEVSEALVPDELEALKFLCLGHIPMRKLEAIQDAKAFLEVLEEKGLIEPGNLDFLRELLYWIGRMDLLATHLGSSREQMETELLVQGKAQVSAYRQLLYTITEDLTPEDVRSVKFLLQKKLPKNKLQDKSMFQVLMEMEKNGLIKEDDLTMLKDILKAFRADIKKRIDNYEENKKENYSEEEVPYPESVSVHPGGQGAEGETTHLPVETYQMKNSPHGYCVILNNIFNNSHCNRKGTVKGGEPVKKVFKWLQFETVEHMDLEAKEIYRKVKEYSERDHSNMDCFICFIFSHGEKDKIKGIDDEFVNIKELVSCFSESNCPSLAGKPKVFFIQVCQGSVGHPGVPGEAGFSGDAETDAVPLTSIRDLADILVAMSTLQGSLFFHSSETGSLYIKYLCDKMELLCPGGTDLETILATVNKEVREKEIKVWKQMSEGKLKIDTQIITTLQKQLIFEIPRGEPSEW
ncbi:caspase-8-like [Pithys albifrons albifrons]|uniref:caspase-8-like n=1 Tax=Pithys albifrons albifrons TaxID=3385563 RepID=UPI003A5D1F27